MTRDSLHLMTLAEVCRELRISPTTGRRLCRSGQLQHFGSGRLRRFAPEHVAAFLEGRKARSSGSAVAGLQ